MKTKKSRKYSNILNNFRKIDGYILGKIYVENALFTSLTNVTHKIKGFKEESE